MSDHVMFAEVNDEVLEALAADLADVDDGPDLDLSIEDLAPWGATACDCDAGDPDDPDHGHLPDPGDVSGVLGFATAGKTWTLAKCLAVLIKEVETAMPSRPTDSDGTIGDASHAARKSDHNPGSDRIVQAVDFTIASRAWGHWYSRWVLARMQARGISGYVIYNRQIANPNVEDGRWRDYYGSNPHTAHVHISVHSGLSRTAAWGFASAYAALIRPSTPAKKTPADDINVWLPEQKRLRAIAKWGPFPLDEGDAFGRDADHTRVFDGTEKNARYGVRLLQAHFGLNPLKPFGPALAARSAKWKAEQGIPNTNTNVGVAMWNAIRPEGAPE